MPSLTSRRLAAVLSAAASAEAGVARAAGLACDLGRRARSRALLGAQGRTQSADVSAVESSCVVGPSARLRLWLSEPVLTCPI